MESIFLLVLKIIGGAIGAVFFYKVGQYFLEKFFGVSLKDNTPKWLRYFISEFTQVLIFLCLLIVIVVFYN